MRQNIVKVRISKVYSVQRVANIKFNLKVLVIRNMIKMVFMHEVLAYLGTLKILSNPGPDSLISIQVVKDKLSQFVALEGDINAENFGLKAFFHFFKVTLKKFQPGVSLHPCYA